MRAKIVFCAAYLLPVLAATLVLAPCIRTIRTDSPGLDCDTYLIEQGLSEVHSIGDTTRWWHGTWVGQVPYWRPLTSYLFLVEDGLVGLDNWRMMMVLNAVPHLAFVSLLYFYVRRVTGNRWIALLATVWFAGWRPPDAGALTNYVITFRTPAMPALMHWKNQPDSFAGVLMLTMAMCSMKRQWWQAVLAFSAAVGFKEIGWLAAPVAVLSIAMAEGGLSRITAIPKHAVLMWLPAVAVLLGLRWSAGAEVWYGYHMGTNINWFSRYSKAAFGYLPGVVLTTQRRAPIGGLSVVAVLALVSRLKLTLKVLLISVAVLLCFLLMGEGDVVVGAIATLTPSCYLGEVLYSALWVYLAYAAMVGSYRAVVPYLVGLELLLTLPFAAASQVLEHALYVPYAFQATIVAISIWSAVERIAGRNHISTELLASTASAASRPRGRQNGGPAINGT